MCGIVGIVDAGGASFPLYYALYALQHRGQESAGISTFNEGILYKYKEQGLLSEVFDADILSELKGKVGIGHVRYPTTGAKIPENIQPFNFVFNNKHISIAHNGNLTNLSELREYFEGRGQIFTTTTDTELIGKILVDELRFSKSMPDAVLACMRKLSGSYSVVVMVDDVLYAFRDPLGIRPLCIGKLDNGYIVASESVAIDALNGKFLRDVEPGELISITQKGLKSVRIARASSPALCVFEYIYFARADSVIDGELVYDVRRRIGKALHYEAPVDAEIVSPVPDSGTAHATGYSESSGIPFRECLIKNRYMGRTFIMPDQKMRENAVRIKLNPVKKHLNDRSVVLVDDSIVRGTTSRRLVDLVKSAGAREVHMRVGSPPIVAPCYLGVDLPTREELIAHKHTPDEVCGMINATSLHHVSIEGLVKATGHQYDELCMGCITGEYPLCIHGEKACKRHIDFVGGSYQSDLGKFTKSLDE